jgi:pyridoxine 5'-phosphate synthase PdxJ
MFCEIWLRGWQVGGDPATSSTNNRVRTEPRLPGVQELNIGHSIVARAVLVGVGRCAR